MVIRQSKEPLNERDDKRSPEDILDRWIPVATKDYMDSEFPTRYAIILVLTGILGGGVDQKDMHFCWFPQLSECPVNVAYIDY